MNKFLSNSVVSLALASLTLAPLSAFAQGKGKGNGKGKGHWNSAPPKKNGRHDNRDWNKNKGWDDDRRNWDRQDIDRREAARREAARREAERREWERQQSWQRSSSNQYNQQSSVQREIDRRQKTKNEWRNLAIAAGAVSVLGLLKKDNTLTFAGAAGALYSLHRYEQDRKSQSSLARSRAYYFSQPYFVRDGVRYDRRLVNQNGQRYYQFIRR